MGADPVAETLRPGRFAITEVRGAHHRYEDLGAPHRALQPVDDDGNRVAGIVDEQLVAADMGLAHRHGQSSLEAAIEIAEARVSIAVGVPLDILVP